MDQYLGINSSDLSFAEISDHRSEVYRAISTETNGIKILKVHDSNGTNSSGLSMFPPEHTRGVIYIIRNPLDVVVSYSKHTGKTFQRTIRDLNDPSFKISSNEEGLKAQLTQQLGTWSEHVESWVDQNEFPVFAIKYEQLLQDCQSIFLRMLNELKIPFDPSCFDHAISASEFSHLQKMEKIYGFREKPLQAELFFRSGKSDIYKEHLNQEQIQDVLACHGDIMHRFGYKIDSV